MRIENVKYGQSVFFQSHIWTVVSVNDLSERVSLLRANGIPVRVPVNDISPAPPFVPSLQPYSSDAVDALIEAALSAFCVLDAALYPDTVRKLRNALVAVGKIER